MLARFVGCVSRNRAPVALSRTLIVQSKAFQTLPGSRHVPTPLTHLRTFTTKSTEEDDDENLFTDITSVMYGEKFNNPDKALTQICHAITRRLDAKVAYVEYEHYKYAVLVVSDKFEGQDHPERRQYLQNLLQEALKNDEFTELWDFFDLDVRAFTPSEVPEEDRAEFERIQIKPLEVQYDPQAVAVEKYLQYQNQVAKDPRDDLTKYKAALLEYFELHGPQDGLVSEASFIEAEKIGCAQDGMEWGPQNDIRVKECYHRAARGKKTITFDGFFEAFDWRFKQADVADLAERTAYVHMMSAALSQGKQKSA